MSNEEIRLEIRRKFEVTPKDNYIETLFDLKYTKFLEDIVIDMVIKGIIRL